MAKVLSFEAARSAKTKRANARWGIEHASICDSGGGEICAHHCTVCEGMDHHWMPECDEDTGDPIMVCKHCDKWRPMSDDDQVD